MLQNKLWRIPQPYLNSRLSWCTTLDKFLLKYLPATCKLTGGRNVILTKLKLQSKGADNNLMSNHTHIFSHKPLKSGDKILINQLYRHWENRNVTFVLGQNNCDVVNNILMHFIEYFWWTSCWSILCHWCPGSCVIRASTAYLMAMLHG